LTPLKILLEFDTRSSSIGMPISDTHIPAVYAFVCVMYAEILGLFSKASTNLVRAGGRVSCKGLVLV
jgi:hypothetical protein